MATFKRGHRLTVVSPTISSTGNYSRLVIYGIVSDLTWELLGGDSMANCAVFSALSCLYLPIVIPTRTVKLSYRDMLCG